MTIRYLGVTTTGETVATTNTDDGSGLAADITLTIGGGTTIKKHLSATKTWDPASVPVIAVDTGTGAITAVPYATTTVTVTGAAVGDTVAVGFSIAVPAGMILSGSVTTANTVTVTLANLTTGAVDLASGTLRADVWQH